MNSKLISSLQKLWIKLADPEYRNAFVSSTISARIAVRIHNLRKKIGWSQAKLAQETGMKQGRISLLEQADYENFTINTLKRIAAAFKVALIVDFVSFPKFIQWSNEIDSGSVVPESFDESQASQAAQWMTEAMTGYRYFPRNEEAVLTNFLAFPQQLIPYGGSNPLLTVHLASIRPGGAAL